MNFHYVLVTFIVGCAIYYSIAVIWFCWMIIFMLMTWTKQKLHTKYQKGKVNEFMILESIWDYEDDKRWTTTANEARYNKLREKFEQKEYSHKVGANLNRQINQAEKVVNKGEKRLRITDEEAIEELKIYNKEIYLVTVAARQKYWVPQFTILVLALVMIYFSIFINTPAVEGSTTTLVPVQYAGEVLFLFYFGGFYQDQGIQSLENTHSSTYWPFFVLLSLLILEKFSTQWLSDRYGTDEATIKTYKEVE